MNLREIISKRALNDLSTPLMKEQEDQVPEEEMPDESEEFNANALKDALSDGQIKMDEFKNDIKASIEMIMKALDKDVILEVIRGLSDAVREEIKTELNAETEEEPGEDMAAEEIPTE